MLVHLTRCEVSLLVEAREAQAQVVDELSRAMEAAGAARVTRQLPGRIYAAPRNGTVADLAARAQRYLLARGHEVKVGDW